VDDLGVSEVEDENVGLIRPCADLTSVFEREVLDQTHGNQVWVGWVELAARDTLVLTVALLEESSGNGVDRACLVACASIIVGEHLEVELEHIDDFVRLKGLLNSVGDSVNELIKLLVHLAVFEGVSLHLVDEVTGLVLHLSVNRSIVVGLGLQSLHLVGSLEANLELLPVDGVLQHRSLLDDSQVRCGLGSLLLDHLEVVITEFFSGLGDTDADERSLVLNLESVNLLECLLDKI